MNFQEKMLQYRKAKSLLFNHYPNGCIKITEKEGLLHAVVKTQLAHFFLSQGYEVYTEANFKDISRCDLIAINRSGFFYIVEIINTESKKSIENKRKKYPAEFIAVDAKAFDYSTFKL